MQQQVKEWACSFSGCDGGNPNAPIWLCGIEWGLRVKDGVANNIIPIAQ